jgi:uncharacterized protein (DUF2132 family)
MVEEKTPGSVQPNNPLHGVKLADILERLVSEYGWEQMGEHIKIRCFTHNPTIKSSLAFLRKTPWARTKVEELYLSIIQRNKFNKSIGKI